MKLEPKRNWEELDRVAPEVRRFLEMVLRDNHLTRTKVHLVLPKRWWTGSCYDHRANRITLSVFRPTDFHPPSEYVGVQNYMRRKSFDFRRFEEWQWAIIHEATHALCDKAGAVRRQGRKKGKPRAHMVWGEYGRIVRKISKDNPHGPLFKRVLLRLAKKYESHAVVQELEPVLDEKKYLALS